MKKTISAITLCLTLSCYSWAQVPVRGQGQQTEQSQTQRGGRSGGEMRHGGPEMGRPGGPGMGRPGGHHGPQQGGPSEEELQAILKMPVKTVEKGTDVINSATLSEARGFAGITPLKVYIKKNVIEKVEPLLNRETPSFWQRITEQMLPKYAGKKIDEIETVDCITGATRSSRAVQDNVKKAVEYYKKNK